MLLPVAAPALAQVGILLAVVIALLGFLILRQMVDRISDQVVGLGRLAQGEVLEATPEQATIVPGLGRVSEIGEIAQAFGGMLRELRASTERPTQALASNATASDFQDAAGFRSPAPRPSARRG